MVLLSTICYIENRGDNMDKIKTSISLDKEVYEKIKDIGKTEDRSFSQQVNKVLKDYLANK
jgi:predicted DNA-binding ribbon-helix-helix protein